MAETPQRRPWPAAAAALAQIDAVLAEPDPQQPDDARWLIAALDPSTVARYVIGAQWRIEGAALDAAPRAHLGHVVALPPQAPPARQYVSPPAETRPGFLGRLRRRLFGEPPQ